MNKIFKMLALFVLAFGTANTAFSQPPPFFNRAYRSESLLLQDSMRNCSFERLVYDSAQNRLYTIMQTTTRVNDSVEYSFPIMMRIHPDGGDVVLEHADSITDYNTNYGALMQQGSSLYWAGWKNVKNMADSANGHAFVTKTDKDFNVKWRVELPNSLKFSRATQIKQYGDTLFVSTFHWSPAGGNAFAPEPVRSKIWKLDTAGNILSVLDLSDDTNVLHAAYDFERLDDGDFILTGRSFQWDGVGNAFSQRINNSEQTLWYNKLDSVFPYSTARKILKLPNSNDFYILGSFVVKQTANSGRDRNPFKYRLGDNGSINYMHYVLNTGLPPGFNTIDNFTLNSAAVGANGRLVAVGSSPIYTTSGWGGFGDGTRGMLYNFNPETPPSNQDGSWMNWYTLVPYPLTELNMASVTPSEHQIMNCQDMYWDSLECSATYTDKDEHFKDVVVLPNGDIVMAGSTLSSILHQTNPVRGSVLRDAWMIKTDSSGCYGIPCGVFDTGIFGSKTDNNLSIKIYPNPATDKLSISWDQAKIGKLESLEIYDVLGRRYLSVGSLKESNEIDISSLPSGMYQVVIKDKNGQRFVQKFVKN